MLLEMSIKNFVIIKDEIIRFENGLNIITGETGSGKSLIIDCMNAICGGKLTKEHIRAGENRSFVQALFTIDSQNTVRELLCDNGIMDDGEEQLIISREINDNGRATCRMNGHIVTLTFLKSITQGLVDIIGQNEHQLLFNSANHIDFLDSFGETKLLSLKQGIKDLVSKIKAMKQSIEKINGDKIAKERKLDNLKFQIEEINNAALKIDEEDILRNRKSILMNAEKLFFNFNLIFETLYNGSESGDVIDKLSSSLDHINEISSLDENIHSFKVVIENALYSLSDIKNELRDYRDNIEFNDKEINEIEERLYLIGKLKRKYGNSISEIISYKDSIQKEYDEIINSEEISNHLTNELEQLYKIYKKDAKNLSDIRAALAKDLENKVEKSLNELNMEGAKFVIAFAVDEENLNNNGFDKVEFLLSSNPGEMPKPLAKVASGGEISRVLLAIKYCLLRNQDISSLVFDEVDAGIGGITADIVGQKLKEISSESQGICITHLPQIACYGDHHIKIEKIVKDDKTFTKIKQLNQEDRIVEISKMLSGNENTEMSYLHAKELLEQKRLP